MTASKSSSVGASERGSADVPTACDDAPEVDRLGDVAEVGSRPHQVADVPAVAAAQECNSHESGLAVRTAAAAQAEWKPSSNRQFRAISARRMGMCLPIRPGKFFPVSCDTLSNPSPTQISLLNATGGISVELRLPLCSDGRISGMMSAKTPPPKPGRHVVRARSTSMCAWTHSLSPTHVQEGLVRLPQRSPGACKCRRRVVAVPTFREVHRDSYPASVRPRPRPGRCLHPGHHGPVGAEAKGKIKSVAADKNEFVMTDDTGKSWTIMVAKDAKIRAERQGLQVGRPASR